MTAKISPICVCVTAYELFKGRKSRDGPMKRGGCVLEGMGFPKEGISIVFLRENTTGLTRFAVLPLDSLALTYR